MFVALVEPNTLVAINSFVLFASFASLVLFIGYTAASLSAVGSFLRIRSTNSFISLCSFCSFSSLYPFRWLRQESELPLRRVERSRLHGQSSGTFNCYRIISNHQIYEVLHDTAAQIILAIDGGDSIRCVAQHLHRPYETMRQTVNRLEGAGYVDYDDGLSVVDERVRGQPASLSLPAPASAFPRSKRCTSSYSSRIGRSRSCGSTPSASGPRTVINSVAISTTIRCS